MFTVADDYAGDAPPRKPKPFLKRGEGVSKRLTAYKLRDEAAALRKQRACDSSSRPWSVNAGDHQQDSSAKIDAEQHKRRTWQPQYQDEVQPLQQQRAQPMHEQPEQAPPRHAASAGSHTVSSSKAAAQMAEQSSWTTGPNVEDLELEEFRALEREILGDVTTSAAHTSTQWQQAQQHPHSQQQTQQQLLRQQEEEEAERQYARYADHAQQQPRQQEEEADLQEPLQQQGMYPRHAASVSDGAADAGGPLQGNNLHDMGFQDDTEWVDTEFSFADLSLEAQQDQTRAAGQHRAHQQRQQQELQQRQEAGMPQQQGPSSSAAVADDLQGPLAEQPYVRSVFKQQQQSSRPVSSHSRVGTAASRRAPRSSKSPAGAAAAGAAATAAADDPDHEMVTVTVPAAAAARLEQLDAAQAALQQERVGLRKMRQELEKAAQQLELQRAAWERDRAAQLTNFEAWKAEETKQLANRRRVLDQQQKALYKMPTKKDKSALEALEAALEREKADARAAAARHKLTVERLRCQAKQLQDRNNELREEVRWHQAQQLNSTAFAAKDSKAPKRPTVSAQTQTGTTLSQPLRASHRVQQQADAWTAAAAAPPADGAGVLYAALFGDDEDDDAVASGSSTGSAQLDGISKLQQQQQPGPRISQRASVDADGSYAAGSSSHGRATGLQQSRAAMAAATAGSDRLSSGSSSGAGGTEFWAPNPGPLVSMQQAAAVDDADAGFSFLQTSGAQQQQQQQQQQVRSSHQADHCNSRRCSTADGGWLVPAGEDAAAAGRSGAGGSSAGRQRQQAPGLRREVLKEYNYPDGKVEQLYDDGSREVRYVNGSSQVHQVDGSMLVSFVNGDVKRQWPDGRVDYFYAEVSVWQCTHPDGLEVFHYPTGQVEGHFTDGRKEVIFADGAARIVTQEGREHDVTRAMLSAAVLEGPPDVNNL